MRFSPVVALGLLPAGIWAQDVFEPVDFNVTQALLDNGVNVSAIPDLAGLAERSLSSGCSVAVSYQLHTELTPIGPFPSHCHERYFPYIFAPELTPPSAPP